MAPPPAWRSELERYFASVPPYYCPPLKARLPAAALLMPTLARHLWALQAAFGGAFLATYSPSCHAP